MLLSPPRYKAGEFFDENMAPYSYKGTEAKFALEHIEVVDADTYILTLLGTKFEVQNLYVLDQQDKDPHHPIYFEIEGRTYHYVFSIWGDRIEIVVDERDTYQTLSVMFPQTRDEVRRSLETIVHDCAV
jgi:hypothetical protein